MSNQGVLVFAGRVAIITGGIRGLGRALAGRLAEAGCGVAVFSQIMLQMRTMAVVGQAKVTIIERL